MIELVFDHELTSAEVAALEAEHGPALRYKSGKNAGELKVVRADIPDYARPKTRMATDYWEFPGYVTPKKEWEGADKGVYSTASDVIKELEPQADKVPFLKAFVGLANVAKDLGTYYITEDEKTKERKGMLSLVGDDGIVHHALNMVNTITGRLSSNSPNLQNVSKGNKSQVKTLFTSRFGEGGRIIASDFCFAAGTPILTGEMEYVPVEDIEVGQELVGFDEHGDGHYGRKFRRAYVTGVKTLKKHCVKVVLDNGDSFVCSADHKWLSRRPGRGQSLGWVDASDLRPGISTLTQAVEYWEPAVGEAAGWVRGILDGEGYVKIGEAGHATSWGIGQKDGGDNSLVCEDIVRYFSRCGDDIRTEHTRTDMVKLMGLRRDKVRAGWYVVGKYRPRRLLEKVKRAWPGCCTSSKDNKVRTVVSVEHLGEMEVHAVQTSTGTMVARGYLTHNCSLEVYVQAILTNCKQLIEDLREGLDLHVVRLAAKEKMPYEEVYKLAKGYTDEQGVKHPPEKEWDYKRTGAKAFSFARAFGAGTATIAQNTGMTVEEVEALSAAEDKRYPEINLYYSGVEDQIKQNRKPFRTIPHPAVPGVMCHIGTSHFKTPDGKIYTYSEYPAPDYKLRSGITATFMPTEIKNFCVQGTGGEFMKAAMLLVTREFYRRKNFGGRALLVNTVHDSMLADASPETGLEAAAVIHACMLEATTFMESKFRWPIPVAVPSDTTWGTSMADEDSIDGLDDMANTIRKDIRSRYLNNASPTHDTAY